MAKKKTSSKKYDLVPKKGGSPSKEVSYQYASQYTQEAFDRAVELMRDSKNESVTIACIKIILDKTMSDLKSSEVAVSGNVNVRVTEEAFKFQEDQVDINE